jgi:hypothetical protein
VEIPDDGIMSALLLQLGSPKQCRVRRELKVKTLKISDQAHAKLTWVVGRLMAETGKMKTYSEEIEAMLNKSVMLSPELLDVVESFIKENVQLGYTTKKEFIQDPIRSRLRYPTADEHPPENRRHTG